MRKMAQDIHLVAARVHIVSWESDKLHIVFRFFLTGPGLRLQHDVTLG